MVSLAVSSMFFHEYTLPEIFSFVGKSGLDAIEFWLETPHFWLRDMPFGEVTTCRKAHPELATLNIHAPILDLNPCSINPEVAAVSVQYAVRSVGIASSVGARVLTVHPGRRTAKRPPGNADFARFDLYISALRTAARENGVKVAIENMEPAINSLLCTPERLRSLLDEIRDVVTECVDLDGKADVWAAVAAQSDQTVQHLFPLAIAGEIVVGDEEPLDILGVVFTNDSLKIVR